MINGIRLEAMQLVVNQEMMSLNRRIQRGIALGRRTPEQMLMRGYLNNFPMNLPDTREAHGGTNRACLIDIGMWDKPLGAYLRRAPDERGRYKGYRRHSEIRLNQTGPQFFATIDGTLGDEGIDLTEMQILQERWSISNDYEYACYQRVLPVYVRLRVIGYTL